MPVAESMKPGLDHHAPKVAQNGPLHQGRNAEVSLLQLRCSYKTPSDIHGSGTALSPPKIEIN